MSDVTDAEQVRAYRDLEKEIHDLTNVVRITADMLDAFMDGAHKMPEGDPVKRYLSTYEADKLNLMSNHAVEMVNALTERFEAI